MIKWIWQLPQHLLALIVILVTKAQEVANGEYVAAYCTTGWSAVSLGQYRIYTDERFIVSHYVRDHEYGHSRQSVILGPFYLLLIGLPSIIGNLLYRVIPFHYYKQPWEAWADKLGGVKR